MLKKPELEKQIEKIPEFETLKVATVRDAVYTSQPNFKAVVEKGKNKAIAVVSDRYALVQMRDIFGCVLSQVDQDVVGEVLYHKGRGQLHIFPGDSKYGIAVLNSVDSSTAIKIFFVSKANGVTVYLAPEVVGYKRLHVGNPLAGVQNFSEILINAQKTWHSIINSLSQRPITSEDVVELKEIVETKELVNVIDEFVKNDVASFGMRPSLWTLILAILKRASESRFKSRIHRERRIRELSAMLLAFALKA